MDRGCITMIPTLQLVDLVCCRGRGLNMSGMFGSLRLEDARYCEEVFCTGMFFVRLTTAILSVACTIAGEECPE